MTNEVKTLLSFLNMPLDNTNMIFNKFKSIDGAIHHDSGGQKRFIYIQGTRKDKVLLVAHADTVAHGNKKVPRKVFYDNDTIYTDGKTILGADDRAGIAMLWLLKDSGHSLLILDGEEYGCIGANYLYSDHKELYNEINTEHQFMIELDRQGSKDFKCYDVGSDNFREYIKTETGFIEPNLNSFTDICSLCHDICGVNLSVGYYFEHTHNEYLVVSEWLNTLNIVRTMLSKDIERFELPVKNNFFNNFLINNITYDDSDMIEELSKLSDEELDKYCEDYGIMGLSRQYLIEEIDYFKEFMR